MGKSVHDKRIVTYDWLIKKLIAFQSRNTLRDRAFIACLALGGFRIREVLGVKNKDKLVDLRRRVKELKAQIKEEEDKKTIKKLNVKLKEMIRLGKSVRKAYDKDKQSYFVEPIRRWQIKKIILTESGVKHKFLQFEQVGILKRREKLSPKKSPPLSYDKEKLLILFLWSYVKTFKNDDAYLFTFTRRFGLNVVKSCLGDDFFPHYLRHWRITRLFGPEYGFNSEMVKQFIGSKNIGSLDPYAHSSSGDLMKRML